MPQSDSDSAPSTVFQPLENGERAKNGRFQTGNPGGPGRRHGSRNRATAMAAALLDGEAEKLTRAAIDMALEGDGAALRLCLDRIVPVVKDRPVAFALPPLTTAADAVRAVSAIVEAVAEGALTPSEAADLSKLLAEFVRAFLAHDLEARVIKLEKTVAEKDNR